MTTKFCLWCEYEIEIKNKYFCSLGCERQAMKAIKHYKSFLIQRETKT